MYFDITVIKAKFCYFAFFVYIAKRKMKLIFQDIYINIYGKKARKWL